MEDLLALLKQFGPMLGLVIYFIWRDSQRELRLGARLDEMQNHYQNLVETTIANNTKAEQEMAQIGREMVSVSEKMNETCRLFINRSQGPALLMNGGGGQ